MYINDNHWINEDDIAEVKYTPGSQLQPIVRPSVTIVMKDDKQHIKYGDEAVEAWRRVKPLLDERERQRKAPTFVAKGKP